MAFADLYLGDSQTMAAEAGVLGVPFVRFNDFVGRIGYLRELEDVYQLGYGIKTDQIESLYNTVEKLLAMPDRRVVFQERRAKMLSEKIDGKLVFVIYHIDELPDPESLIERWQSLAHKEGLPPFLFLAYADDIARTSHPSYRLCEKTVHSCKYGIDSIGKNRRMRKFSSFAKSLLSRVLSIPLNIHEYKNIRSKLVTDDFRKDDIIPVLLPNWDNTPRREAGALILHNATPEQFFLHCQDVFDLIKKKETRTVFLKSWNEWGEGNYMEPCLKYGHGYLEALARAIRESN